MTTKTYKIGTETYEFTKTGEEIHLNGKLKTKFIVHKLIDNDTATFEYAPVYAKSFQQAYEVFFEEDLGCHC
jgi:hypothetical protein